ncbi:nitroreductase family protein [Saccharicrinis fermentans]|nr:nitroreductase family protein [Saccharicrinis fermentans]
MNILKITNIVLALCVLLLIIKINFSEEKNMKDLGSNTLEIIHKRKSVRNYTDKEVSKTQLETLVKAGMAAPTAVNKQPWAFIVVNDRAALDELGDHLPYAKMAKKASAAIVVCGDLTKALEGWEQEFWIQDCSAASQNILLAAEALGLGAVWTAAYPAKDRMATVRRVLGLPKHIIPLNVIPIGYPKGIEKPKDKWRPENLHWGKW